MSDVLTGYMYAALFATLFIGVIESVRYYFWARKLDRIAAADMQMRDWERGVRLRMAGASEALIAELQGKIEAKRLDTF